MGSRSCRDDAPKTTLANQDGADEAPRIRQLHEMSSAWRTPFASVLGVAPGEGKALSGVTTELSGLCPPCAAPSLGPASRISRGPFNSTT